MLRRDRNDRVQSHWLLEALVAPLQGALIASNPSLRLDMNMVYWLDNKDLGNGYCGKRVAVVVVGHRLIVNRVSGKSGIARRSFSVDEMPR